MATTTETTGKIYVLARMQGTWEISLKKSHEWQSSGPNTLYISDFLVYVKNIKTSHVCKGTIKA